MTRILLAALLLLTIAGCGPNPESAKEKGFAYYDLKKYIEALPLLEKAFAGELDDPELIVRLAYCRATVKGDAMSAIEILRDSALKYPKYARTYFELGFIAHNFGPSEEQQNIKQALGFTKKAVALDSTNWTFKDNLGMFFFMLGDLDSAEFWFRKAKELNANHAELNTRLEQIAELKIRKALEDSVKALDTLNLELTDD